MTRISPVRRPLRFALQLALSAVVAAGMLFAPAGFARAAEPDTAPGDSARAKSQQCIGCHEIPGYKTAFPSVYPAPKLFGQSADYLAAAMRAYRDGARSHPSMVGIAAQLSDADIAEIAAFYAEGK